MRDRPKLNFITSRAQSRGSRVMPVPGLDADMDDWQEQNFDLNNERLQDEY